MAQDRQNPNESLEEMLGGPSREGAAPANDDGGDFTRMFRALSLTEETLPEEIGGGRAAPVVAVTLPTPISPSAAPAAPASARPLTNADSGGFTQVFQQIAKPASAPPGVRKVEAAAPAGGDFTQIFSSFQAGSQPVKPPVGVPKAVEPVPPRAEVAGAASAPALPVFAAPMPAQPGEFTQMFRSLEVAPEPSNAAVERVRPAETTPQPAVPTPPALPVFAPPTPAQPGEFTQMFRSLPVEPEPMKAAVEPVKSVEPAAPAVGGRAEEPGSFTQIFQQIKPTAAKAEPVAGGPVFGAPAPAGSFTEMFRAPSSNSTAPAAVRNDFGRGEAAFAAPVSSKPAGQADGGGFTQMFQALSESPARPSAQPQGIAFGGSAAAPMFPAASASPAQPLAGGGEFTRLMHSLEQPSAPMQSAAPQPAAALPFFAEAPQAGGTSEYTRVMRGPGFKDPARPAAPAVAAAPVAPGMSIAPAKAEEKPAEKKAGGMSKGLVILLVVFNVVLLVALIVLAVILLKKH